MRVRFFSIPFGLCLNDKSTRTVPGTYEINEILLRFWNGHSKNMNGFAIERLGNHFVSDESSTLQDKDRTANLARLKLSKVSY